MKVRDIQGITRKDAAIHYVRRYTGTVVIELLGDLVTFPLEFQLEQQAVGGVVIRLTVGRTVDYPLAPLKKELRNFIVGLESAGKLPR